MLITLAGAPLTAMRDFVTVQRIVRPGDEMTAVWARDGERFEVTLPLG